MSIIDVIKAAQSIETGLIALRRAIHREPELGLETPKTLAKVREALADVPLEWREAKSCTGAIATLKGTAPRPGEGKARRVLLRGDMDALPLEEKTGLDFSSQIAGRMHACGHDAHTAMLVGAARVLAENRAAFCGTVDFMFQPGEEGFHGARHMLEEGLVAPDTSAAFALHVMPNAPFGLLASRAGALMAAADSFDITVKGRGGHASMPHDGADPVPAAAAIVSALQAMVTRRFDAHSPVVITVTRMEAGAAYNVIPDEARLAGTIRTLSPQHRAKAHELIAQCAADTAKAHGVEAETAVTEGFPVTICDARALALGKTVTRRLFGASAWRTLDHPIMGAEDFAYVLEKIPGAMMFLGVAHEGEDWRQCCAIHSPRMMVDEKALPRGSAFLAGCALEFLDHGWASASSQVDETDHQSTM